jgi:HAD superfamily hydrolase (TIGR01490 family)
MPSLSMPRASATSDALREDFVRAGWPYTRRVQPAAFFDLDRTLLRRSSALALAGGFRQHGVIGRGQLAKAAAWQLLFAARGASAETVRKAAEDGLMILKGFGVAELRGLVRDAMEPVLKPLVYQEALALVEQHRGRGEPVYIVSATLQEIVEELANELGFDGAVGSTCEIADGVYTGASLRACHGAGKAAAIRDLAAAHGYDLAASTAYSDSHTDLPFLEAVGYPVAVNPDRELRRIAEERGWDVVAFAELAYPPGPRRLNPALVGIPLVLGAGAAMWAARRRAA